MIQDLVDLGVYVFGTSISFNKYDVLSYFLNFWFFECPTTKEIYDAFDILDTVIGPTTIPKCGDFATIIFLFTSLKCKIPKTFSRHFSFY